MRLPRQITARKAHFRSQSGARWIARQRHLLGAAIVPKLPAAVPLSDRLSSKSLHELARIAESIRQSAADRVSLDILLASAREVRRTAARPLRPPLRAIGRAAA